VFEGQVEEKKRGISSKQSIFPFLFVKDNNFFGFFFFDGLLGQPELGPRSEHLSHLGYSSYPHGSC
jgi:hypothetical protein